MGKPPIKPPQSIHSIKRPQSIQLGIPPKKFNRVFTNLKQCKCKCKSQSEAKCVSKKYICQQSFCVQKCKRRSKLCYRLKKLRYLSDSQKLPSTEIKCGIKNNEAYSNVFNPDKRNKKARYDPSKIGPDSKITFGETSKGGEWPWQVSLRNKPNSYSEIRQSDHFCGGVLIDSETVLTAAHCVYDCFSRAECKNKQ